MIKNFSYLSISDIHLGNKRNTTKFIINNLYKFFEDFTSKSQFTTLNIIFIAGDLFDTLLDFTSDDIHEITIWLSDLMTFCYKYNIKLRILEGTPSHDWKQSKIINTIAKMRNNDLDVKYIDTLSIEYLKDLQLHILYMPDEWSNSANETFKQVNKLLKDNNIIEVDIAIMHGMFAYQLKQALHNVQKHDERNYLDIVKYFINIGHIHTFSTYERIIANGSFDRLSHNEEEPKGGVVCRVINNESSYSFIENKGARIFKTILIKDKDIDKALKKIDKEVTKLPNNSFVRIKSKKSHPIFNYLDDFKVKYPFINFSKTSIEDENSDLELLNINNNLLEMDYSPITITKDNVITLLMNKIANKYSLTNYQNTLLSKILIDNL